MSGSGPRLPQRRSTFSIHPRRLNSQLAQHSVPHAWPPPLCDRFQPPHGPPVLDAGSNRLMRVLVRGDPRSPRGGAQIGLFVTTGVAAPVRSDGPEKRPETSTGQVILDVGNVPDVEFYTSARLAPWGKAADSKLTSSLTRGRQVAFVEPGLLLDRMDTAVLLVFMCELHGHSRAFPRSVTF